MSPRAPGSGAARLGIVCAAITLALTAAAPAFGQSRARGDRVNIEGLAEQLSELRAEVAQLGQGVEAPDRSPEAARERANRHLVDAQVAFGTGDYDTSAVMLYEYIDKHPDSRSLDTALYYLAESLFQRADHMAARDRFTELVAQLGPDSRFYQQTLERLVELSLALRDDTDVERWLAALDRLPPETLRPSVHYVRGKYAYAQDSFDAAVEHFARVPLDTEYFFQARYFMGVCYVSMNDLARAETVFTDLVARKAQDRDGWRVIELAHLARGRVFYETDRLTEAVDAYLEVDRRSDLFEDAVYELAWVFVKARQFDKALLALELLSDKYPNTSIVPSVQILEGNLRIRKAQELNFLDADESGPEYERALATFVATRERFATAHEELTTVLEEHIDPQTFLAQITGRAAETFEVRATLPEVAAAWLRELPEVKRVVAVERDLEEIATDVDQSERMIERLEHALAAPARVDVFPGLAKKRNRAIEILEQLFALRRQLAASERGFLYGLASGEQRRSLRELETRGQELSRELSLLPNGEAPYAERIRRARRGFSDLEAQERELVRLVDSAAAKLVAVEKYYRDRDRRARNDAELRAELRAQREELQGLREELDQLRRDTTLGKDMAGTGDEAALRGKSLRAELRQVLEREQGLALAVAGRAEGGDVARAERLLALYGTAQEITDEIDALERLIDEVVEFSLADVRSALVEERARLVGIKRELGDYEAESSQLGGRVVGASFDVVKDRIYDVLVRADVGVVDVTWSQKEDGDQDIQRLQLDELRDLRMIEDQLRDLDGDDQVVRTRTVKRAKPKRRKPKRKRERERREDLKKDDQKREPSDDGGSGDEPKSKSPERKPSAKAPKRARPSAKRARPSARASGGAGK